MDLTSVRSIFLTNNTALCYNCAMEKKVLKPNGGYPMHSFEALKELYEVYIVDTKERQKILNAYKFVLEAHEEQFRKSGEPYVHHLIEVAYILAELQSAPDTICAGLLHDVVEDTDVPIEYIEKNWGSEVAKIVDALTKIQRMKLSKRTEEDFASEDHRKIFIGMARDIRVIVVKLADRLHNMRTLDALSNERQFALSKETLEVFVPIAHRLGLYQVKSELEDLCLKYQKPEIYNEIKDFLDKRIKNREKSLEALKKRIADILFENKIPFLRIESRVKSIYSLYKKIYIKGYHIDEIYDILALRVITKTILNCYETLGLVNMTYKALPNRFKDYIALPKPNLYQSLHTSVISGDGNIYEVQIRTEEMDTVAETGIAAHWKYKEGSNYDARAAQKEVENQLHWFRDFVKNSENSSENAKEFMDNLTHDIFEANVYVFTPMGKVIDLPQGSTPLDFAYRVHTKVGDSASGAMINGVLVPLNTELKTGDVVEIRTSKTAAPNEGWLKLVKTVNARDNIRKYLQRKQSEDSRYEYIQKGKTTLINGLIDYGLSEEEILHKIDTPHTLNNFNIDKLDSLYYLVSQKTVTVGNIASFLNLKKKTILKVSKFDDKAINSTNPILVSGSGDIKAQLAKCCRPIPGDDIVGYISKGRGISIHRKDCPNIENEGKSRLFHDVKWNPFLAENNYPVDLKISAYDREGLLTDVLANLSLHKIPVSDISANINYEMMVSTIKATIAVKSIEHLNNIIKALINIHSVFEITRVIH